MGTLILMIIKIFGVFFTILPRSVQLVLGNGLGLLLRVIGFRFRVVQQNVALAFPGESQIQHEIAKKSYDHLGNLLLEILMVFGFMRQFVLKSVDFFGIENFREAQKLGRGVIILSSHLGNWEVMAAAGGVLAQADLMLVTKRLKPEWLHQAVQEGRLKSGVKACYEPRTLRQILSHLKKNGTVGFVLDQYSGPPVGVRVPFFGVPVGTSLALAALVKRTKAPVLPVENYRKSDGRWVVRVDPPLVWEKFEEDSRFELAANTANFVQVLEKSIRSHPEQWLWTHRRFKGDLGPLLREEWKTPRARK